ncbi:penicillin-insensitive murein endopeptidase [Methylomonas sp. SURF-2]|uniref:Penicillin-insensitive murein endopeptidase n=1 Tax=Methylomonas subterranea TaxID=2952225 RepID=A0ABT1TFQ8_9GAMM|nr:penicillin-insensitive murein endopeptidase [Methylomonas sp. SURF-2]MCQ8104292.1 penicillin-insensitive murein endopeptidase [Methylomonas sp. SURF-2]
MFKILVIALYLLGSFCFADSNPQSWAQRTTPTSDSISQSIGTFTSGCVAGAMALPTSGIGYQAMRLSRNRVYGHSALIQFIQQLGQVAADQQLGTLLIGDLGQARGGPTPSGHRSHQTGLDVDIWFLLSRQLDNRLLSANERETWSAPSMVNLSTDTVDYRQWTEAHEKILQAAANSPEVDRIFVNPSIKQELCKHKTASAAEWLRKIRPWWKHDDHFHVRLKCPDGNLYCQGQPALPIGDGCDASLAWWFSAEAKTPSKPAKPTAPPPLPALCEQVLNQ